VAVRRGIAARHDVDIAENRATDLARMQRRKERPRMSELAQSRHFGWREV
jgi:hypothetical protein